MGLRLLLPLTAETSLTFVWLALLLTYFLHAAVAALVAGWLARRSMIPAHSNRLWKLALFGPLATATLSRVLSSSGQYPHVAALPVSARSAHALPPWAAHGSSASQLLGVLLVAALCVGGVRFAVSLRALRRALAGRVAVRNPHVSARFERLRTRAGLPQLRLSESQHVPGPLIVGRREICVPSSVLASCSEAELDAIFAHELAHIERRDGLWFPLVGLVEAVLWFQPFNRRVATRYRQSAELACDDRAVQLTGAPVALARALTRIAEATLSARMGVLTPGMASSSLERVRRLLAEPSAAPKQASWAALACLCLLGLASPSLDIERRRSAPDLEMYEATMHALSAQAQQLEAELAHTKDNAADLEQALRHVRATQVWSEHQFETEQAAWDYESR
ncbi:MAG TPA: M56 family metallopeptidase [Polyangiales bacterium]|nr:M56 family metallopeptidase [Polyangiales bacterium]